MYVLQWFECEHGNEEENQQLQRGGNTVGDETTNTLEDTTRNDNAMHYGRKPFFSEDNIGRSPGRISGPSYGHAHIGAFERGRVVDTVASHAHLLEIVVWIYWVRIRG